MKHHHHNSSSSGSGQNSIQYGKHAKHSSHGKDDHNNKSGSGNERPSIQQTLYSIPSLLQQENSGIGGGTATLEPVLGENVMLQEWLQKRSTSLQLVWKRRWCVLQNDRLCYYRSNTDAKPLGVLDLGEYSILASGPDISRKSKFAFRLSSPGPIPHQHRHHVFYTDSAQSLQDWMHALQVHINHAAAAWSIMTAASAGLGLQASEQAQQLLTAGSGEQSIIDKVLDRLQLEDTLSDMNRDAAALEMSQTRTSQLTGTDGTSLQHQHGYLPYLPDEFPKLYGDDSDTWSSTSSMPNKSNNNSSNIEYVYTLTQQNQQQQTTKSSMDSMRDPHHAQHSPLGIHPGYSASQHSTHTGSYTSSSGNPSGSSFTEQYNISEANRSPQQLTDYQGRASLQQPRVTAGSHGSHSGSSSMNSIFHQQTQSPRMYPIRSSVHSGISADNSVPSPATSTAGSPFASPVLTSQPHNLSSNSQGNNNTTHPSPRAFYRVIDSNSPKRPESVASSTSVSTIASFGDMSTVNDPTPDNGVSMPPTESSQYSKVNSGNKLLELVTGGKHRKDRKEQRTHSSASSQSGSGSNSSPALKLFNSSCSYSGCTQPAKTCIYHSKKYLPESSRKNKDEGGKTPKKLWPGSDRNASQGNISVMTGPHFNSDGSSSSFPGSKSGRGFQSKSMVSLSRDSDFGVETSSVPLPPSALLSLVSSPTRRRSPSVSVADDALVASQQQRQQQHLKQLYNSDPTQQLTGINIAPPQTPLPLPPSTFAPSQALPPLRPRFSSTPSIKHHNGKESLSLSRKMGLQIGPEFGALDKNALSGTALDGKFFVANHHRTMQKLQVMQSWKIQPTGPLPPIPGMPQSPQTPMHNLQSQQSSVYNVGVSRHIIAPDELALAIEQEAKEMRSRQARQIEAQRNRPTSMIGGNDNAYHSTSLQVGLSTVSETSTLTDAYDDSVATSQISSPRENQSQEGDEPIISSLELLSFSPTSEMIRSLESQRSPISGIISVPHPLSLAATPPLPPSMLQSTDSGMTTTTSSSDKANSANDSPCMTPISASSMLSLLGPSVLSKSQSKPGNQALSVPAYSQQQQQQSSWRPTSPLDSVFSNEKQDFPMRSLPPPKRPFQGSAHFGPDPRVPHRGGLPRRSSAAAAVTLSSSSPGIGNSNIMASVDEHSSNSASGGPLQPGYFTRRQSSSPVMIRLSEQGGQNISPLLSNGTTRTFTGEAPSGEVCQPALTPISSPSGSSFSTSTAASSICSFVTSRRIGSDHHGVVGTVEESLMMTGITSGQHTPNGEAAMSPSLEYLSSPSMAGSKKFQSVPSPLAAVTPAEGSSPAESPSTPSAPRMEGPVMAHDVESALTTLAATGIRYENSNEVSSVTASKEDVAPRRRMLTSVPSFVFPAPLSKENSISKAALGGTARSRSLSTCSVDSYTASSDTSSVPEDYSPHSSRAVSPVLSPSLHAAAVELYPGLRKLSLFTAAVGGHPPPALLSGRKGSTASGISGRDHHYRPLHHHHYPYHRHAASATATDDDDGGGDDDAQSEDLQNDEDWAGNLKSTRRLNEQALPSPLSLSVSRRPSASVLLSTPPPSSPLPPLPPLPPSQPSTPKLSPTRSPAPAPSVPLPAIPSRSPHRSAPLSPTALRSSKSHQHLPPLPATYANNDSQSQSPKPTQA
ncbi:hypothetical protein BGZ58_004431 [Dissophora ornata]|nr:hypothetical protein BGZ58_004431 [Dissophora ornata]